MRKLIMKIILFVAVLHWLDKIALPVLLAGMGVAFTLIICLDLLLDSASSR
jgi:hypothetical protein